ncbi:MAG TPA: MFS transporter [Trebonia sp.]
MTDIAEKTPTIIPKAPSRIPKAPSRLPSVLLPAIAFFMVTLDSLVVVTALPSIHAALGGGDGALQWIVNAYNLTFAAGIVTGAALGERYGRRRVFLAGLAVFTLASAACAVAPTLGLLIAFRAVQGLGGAILAPVGLTLVTAAFPAAKRGAAVGLWGGIAGLGVAAGPLVGGAVTQGLDWHWIFWVNVPFGVLAFAGCAFVLSDGQAGRSGPRQPLDLPGMALAALTLAALVDGLVEAPTRGWTDGRVLLMLALAAVSLVAFVVRQARAAAPMIPLSLFRSRVFSAASAANLLGMGATFAAAYITSEFFQVGLGYTPLGTGLRFLPWTATPLLIAPLAGLLFDRLGARRVAAPGLLLQAAGFIWIVMLAGAHASWGAYVVPFILAGVGISMALPSLPAAALSAVPPASLGAAAGVANTAQRVGSVVGIAVVTAVFDANGSLASAHATTLGYRPALLAAALLSALGAAAALAAGGKPRLVTPSSS